MISSVVRLSLAMLLLIARAPLPAHRVHYCQHANTCAQPSKYGATKCWVMQLCQELSLIQSVELEAFNNSV